MRYIDIHSHLNFSQFDDDRDEVIERMRQAGVGTITVGTSRQTSREAVALAEKTQHMWATVGVHPTEENKKFPENEFEALLNTGAVVAVGECGFDYFRSHRGDVKHDQEQLFGEHVAFAQEHDLPLVLHIRPSKGSLDAYEDAIAFLSGFQNLRGVSHFFVGTAHIAEQFVQQGIGVSFDGPITFTDEYDDAVRAVPLEFLHAETDAPFAAPAPYRGKRNEPAYVSEVVNALARIREEDEGVVRKQLLQNAQHLFGMTFEGGNVN